MGGLGVITALPALFKFLEDKIKTLKPHDWFGSHNGEPLDAVEAVDCGINAATKTAWVKARYKEDGIVHTLWAKMPAQTAGQRGGHDTITLDGADVEADDFVLGTRIVFPHLRVVAEFKFTDAAGAAHRIRFDGDIV